MGAKKGEIESEIIEESSFNMVRGFLHFWKNIRVKAQIKPGLLDGIRVMKLIKAKNKLGLVFFPAFDWAISQTHPERGGKASIYPGTKYLKRESRILKG